MPTRRRVLACACTVAGTAVASGIGAATGGDGDLTLEIVRHASAEPDDDVLAAVREGVDLFAETWTEATPGTAEVTLETDAVADFEIEPAHGETLDALETDDALRGDRTAETVTLVVVADGATTAGAMRGYAGRGGGRSREPGAYGYVNTELAALFGTGIGTPRELLRNFAAHECGHAVVGWTDFPHYPVDATESEPSPERRAHSCGAQDHPDARGRFVRHGITPMATGYSAIESRNTPRDHPFATERGPIDDYAEPVTESPFYLTMDYVPAFSDTARAAMAHHYERVFA
ncbi:hypothetical protein A6E15_07735 [Natrinema saccharevitans]|uniref:Peptidase n=1 Tax=Natrinema saccharevitans TaxID=301967 RepID=A0A1S8AVE6_9EURY|nr:hypothetical protein [Natrinema saccharevitans]OLZ40888.1 hypothetical protein A6E15_07735 [Natrinema saccharevitans]